MSIETAIVQWINSTDLKTLVGEASMDVPTTRPARFTTVERVGGPAQLWRDQPRIAIQTWAPTRVEASDAADLLRNRLHELLSLPQVAAVAIVSVINWPDLQSITPRYQVLVDLDTTA